MASLVADRDYRDGGLSHPPTQQPIPCYCPRVIDSKSTIVKSPKRTFYSNIRKCPYSKSVNMEAVNSSSPKNTIRALLEQCFP